MLFFLFTFHLSRWKNALSSNWFMQARTLFLLKLVKLIHFILKIQWLIQLVFWYFPVIQRLFTNRLFMIYYLFQFFPNQILYFVQYCYFWVKVYIHKINSMFMEFLIDRIYLIFWSFISILNCIPYFKITFLYLPFERKHTSKLDKLFIFLATNQTYPFILF